HIAGPADSTDAQQRVRGWQSTLMNAGARVPALLQGDWSAQSGYELGLEILSRPDITAIFSGNDQMALGLLRRLHEAGRRVPGDVSIVGFDDLPESSFFNPPL